MTENRKIIRCAVIGLGRIAWSFHLPQIAENPGFRLIAAADPDVARLNEAKKTFGVPMLFEDFRDLPFDRLDLAVIASPTFLHREQSIFCMEHGVDVFCDKPAAPSLADALKMHHAALKCGRRLSVYQPYRLCFDTLTAESILESGKLGTVYSIRRECSGFVRRNDWQSLKSRGGGMLLNYGAHYIDQMLYLMHDVCADAVCRSRRILSLGDAEDVVSVLLTGKSGCLYQMNINQASCGELPALTLFGNLGTAWMRPDRTWQVCRCLRESMPPVRLNALPAAPGRAYPSENIPWIRETVPEVPEDLSAYYRRCCDYYALGKPPVADFADTLEVMRTIELCRESENMGKNGAAAEPHPGLTWKRTPVLERTCGAFPAAEISGVKCKCAVGRRENGTMN